MQKADTAPNTEQVTAELMMALVAALTGRPLRRTASRSTRAAIARRSARRRCQARPRTQSGPPCVPLAGAPIAGAGTAARHRKARRAAVHESTSKRHCGSKPNRANAACIHFSPTRRSISSRVPLTEPLLASRRVAAFEAEILGLDLHHAPVAVMPDDALDRDGVRTG